MQKININKKKMEHFWRKLNDRENFANQPSRVYLPLLILRLGGTAACGVVAVVGDAGEHIDAAFSGIRFIIFMRE